jgi:hypothetical protein
MHKYLMHIGMEKGGVKCRRYGKYIASPVRAERCWMIQANITGAFLAAG